MKRQIKVLPLPRLFANYIKLFGPLSRATLTDLVGKGYRKCKPRFNRPGWYYDRKTKKSWYELEDGRAFMVPVLKRDFVYELDSLTSRERPLSPEERAAIETLRVYRNSGHKALNSLSGVAYKDDCNSMLKRVKRDATYARFQILGR